MMKYVYINLYQGLNNTYIGTALGNKIADFDVFIIEEGEKWSTQIAALGKKFIAHN